MIGISLRRELMGSTGPMRLEVDLEIEEGSFVAIAGESGSGKTTLLRILAGLEEAEGRIEVGGEVWQDRGIFLPPRKRRIGFVFQDYALFENMTVRENLLFVRSDWPLAERLLALCSLEELAEPREVRESLSHLWLGLRWRREWMGSSWKSILVQKRPFVMAPIPCLWRRPENFSWC